MKAGDISTFFHVFPDFISSFYCLLFSAFLLQTPQSAFYLRKKIVKKLSEFACFILLYYLCKKEDKSVENHRSICR